MPKERRSCQPRGSPYPPNLSSIVPVPLKNPPPPTKETEEWDEIRCPICLDHPHNAVLLVCSSIKDGCRPFICDTSQRHSNCLDQFRKMSEQICKQSGEPKFSCPLCRGEIVKQIIMTPTRDYLNKKVRSCSKESCGFSGTYKELRKHAWEAHPAVRPADPDPERQNEWRQMEQRSNFADIVSTMQSSIENRNGDASEFTGIVRVPSMSVVVIVRISSTTVSTRRFTSSETIVIDDDDDDDGDDDDHYDGDDRGDCDGDGDEDDGSEADDAGGDEDDDVDLQGRRRPRRRIVISDDESDGCDDA